MRIRLQATLSAVWITGLLGCSGVESFGSKVRGEKDGNAVSANSLPRPVERGKDDDEPPPEEPADEPVWVNTPALTCDYVDFPTSDTVRFGCKIPEPDEGPKVVAPELLRWSLLDGQGFEIPDALEMTTGLEADFIVASMLLPDTDVMVYGPSDAILVPKTPLAEELPGLDEPELAQCLRDGEFPVEECFGPPEQVTEPVEANHPRFVLDGNAYYLGNLNENCEVTCSPYGGVSTTTIDVIGSGGTGAACQTVLRGLLNDQNVPVTTLSGPAGIGCHLDGGQGYHFAPPVTNYTARIGGTQRVCGCNQ